MLVGWSEAKGDIPETGDDAPDFIIGKAEDLLEILASSAAAKYRSAL